MKNSNDTSGITQATFQLLAKCVKQMHHRVPQITYVYFKNFSTSDFNYLSSSGPLLTFYRIMAQYLTHGKVKTRAVRHNTCNSRSVLVLLSMTYMSLFYIQYSDLWYWHHPRGESPVAVCEATC
jgi:hypothetical protein